MNPTKIKLDWAKSVIANCLCTGCGLCQSINGRTAIGVGLTPNGYLRPITISSISQEEGARLNAICPGCYIEHNLSELSGQFNVLWGPLLQTRVGHAADPKIRFNGSSGGVISALGAYLLESGKVDYVLHTIASTLNPLLNTSQISRSRSDLLDASGSRYSPSSPLIDFESCLARSETFAFIGKPCDVAALHNYARMDMRIKKKMLYTISFMCAGIPSLNGTLALLKQLNLAEADIKTLRYRGQGWPGCMLVEDLSGKIHSLDYSKSWGYLSKYLQFRCKICPDGTGEFSDITCGDAWYLKDGQPDFSEQDGRSILISRTERGEQLIQNSIKAEYLCVMPMQVTDLPAMQPYQAMRKKLVASRLFALKVLGVQTPKYANLQLSKAACQAGIHENIKSFLGTVVRVLLRVSFETPQLHGIWEMVSRWLSSFRHYR